MELLMFYVYGLIDPRTDEPFYIGKGKAGSNRHRRHFYETEYNTENKHKFYKIQWLKQHGYDIPVHVFVSDLSESEAYCTETKLIIKYGRENIDECGILTNICLEAHPPSWKGKSRSRESVELSRLARTGTRVVSQENRKLISEKLKGRTQLDTTKQKRKDTLRLNPKAYGRKRWLFVAPTGTTYEIKHLTRNQFCKLHNLSVSAAFYTYLNTNKPCVVTAKNGKNNGWMFFDDSELIDQYLTSNSVVPISI